MVFFLTRVFISVKRESQCVERGGKMRPKVDFEKLMSRYNDRFGCFYGDVGCWLFYLNSRMSVRGMAKRIGVDRGVLARKLREL